MEESIMISKMFGIAPMIVLAGLALSSAAWATCSNASLSGTYGFVDGGTDSSGTPTTIVGQATFDSTTATFSGIETISQDGVVGSVSLTGKYAMASNCSGKGTVTVDKNTNPIYFVVTSTGVLFVNGKTGGTTGGFGVAQGSPSCTNAGVKGSFGFQATGAFLAGAPATGPVHFIGELALTVNTSGDGVIGGEMAGSEDGTIFTFAEEPVTGSYTVATDCRGTATITPKGRSEMHFSLVVVDGGKEILAIETDADTVVSGTLQR
jgi:hypothetical protein